MLSDEHCKCAEVVHGVWRSLQVCRSCSCCLMNSAGVQKLYMLFDDHCRCAKGVHVVWWSLQMCKWCSCCLTITAGVQKVSMLSDKHCRCAEVVHVVWLSLQVCKRCPCWLTRCQVCEHVPVLSEDSSLTISQGLTIAPTFCAAAPLCRCWMATYSAKARGELLLHVAPHHLQVTLLVYVYSY